MPGCSERRDCDSQCVRWHSILTPIHQHHIWWQLQQRQIIESFVKSNMVAALDSVGEQTTPHNILQHVGSAPKKDSFLGVLDALCSILPRKDLDPQTTTKFSKQPEIVFLSMQFLVSRLCGVSLRQRRILDAQKMSKRMGPEFHWQTSTDQHRSDRLVCRLIAMFNKPVLMVRSRACNPCLVTKLLLEQIPNCFGSVQLSSLTHEDGWMFHIVFHVLLEPPLQPCSRWRL